MRGDVKALIVATGDPKIEVAMCLLKSDSLGKQGRVMYSSEIRYSSLSVSVLVKAGLGVLLGAGPALVHLTGKGWLLDARNGLYWIKIQVEKSSSSSK